MRQSIIRIRAEIQIPYDRKKFGSAAAAEKHCEAMKEALDKVLADAVATKWEPEHTTVEA